MNVGHSADKKEMEEEEEPDRRRFCHTKQTDLKSSVDWLVSRIHICILSLPDQKSERVSWWGYARAWWERVGLVQSSQGSTI